MDQTYTIRELTGEECWPLMKEHQRSVFEDIHSYNPANLFNEAEQATIKTLEQSMGSPFKLYLGVFDADNNFVGWSWGTQESGSVFYMVNSGVLKEHRRKGIYSALLEKSTEILSQKGFQLIYSRHSATNNAVLIPKLKAGFIISKMEIDDRFGVLIHLHFYTNKIRRKLMDYRVGLLKPDAEIRKVFGA